MGIPLDDDWNNIPSKKNVTLYDQAMSWLDEMYDKSETGEEQVLIDYITEMMWRYEDMRNS